MYFDIASSRDMISSGFRFIWKLSIAMFHTRRIFHCVSYVMKLLRLLDPSAVHMAGSYKRRAFRMRWNRFIDIPLCNI